MYCQCVCHVHCLHCMQTLLQFTSSSEILRSSYQPIHHFSSKHTLHVYPVRDIHTCIITVHTYLDMSVVLCKEFFNELLLSTFSNSRAASLVISSQFIGLYQTDIFMEKPIILNFSFSAVSIIQNQMQCTYISENLYVGMAPTCPLALYKQNRLKLPNTSVLDTFPSLRMVIYPTVLSKYVKYTAIVTYRNTNSPFFLLLLLPYQMAQYRIIMSTHLHFWRKPAFWSMHDPRPTDSSQGFSKPAILALPYSWTPLPCTLRLIYHSYSRPPVTNISLCNNDQMSS